MKWDRAVSNYNAMRFIVTHRPILLHINLEKNYYYRKKSEPNNFIYQIRLFGSDFIEVFFS